EGCELAVVEREQLSQELVVAQLAQRAAAVEIGAVRLDPALERRRRERPHAAGLGDVALELAVVAEAAAERLERLEALAHLAQLVRHALAVDALERCERAP